MLDLVIRPRRLRSSGAMRELVRETVLQPSDFIYPIFVIPGEKKRQGIETLPGIDHVSADEALIEAKGLESWNSRDYAFWSSIL